MAPPSATTTVGHSAYLPSSNGSSAPANGHKNGTARPPPSIPKTMKRWVVRNFTGPEGLEIEEDVPMPELGPNDVLVKLSAASLNYRDLVVTRGQYPWALTLPVIPCSDGAGTVAAVGSRVTSFAPGDAVATVMNGAHQFGPVQPTKHLEHVLGGSMPGTLTEFGVFPEAYLIDMPRNLTMVEGSTLSCAALTAWDALYGLEGKHVRPGDWVLTMGSGGVSCFAVQFAKAAGAKVIATTSSDKKAERLRSLGADHVVNYREVPDWGAAVTALTPDGAGVDLIVEVGGATTLKQSLSAIKAGGLISLVGFRGGAPDASTPDLEPRLLDVFFRFCVVRTSFVGPRTQYEAMNRAIEALDIKPAIDERVFEFGEAREAFAYMESQGHFGKVCVKLE
ncbi:Zinc-type alcohol dehydrogenase-like protein [Lasiodiplodia theobromae]|uniref:Zinc-type alcohol dehydrogenase-like protein n=1 Tax=Lasiodiplodia theobromae TaxID=45133 RepID=A0A5N5DFV2_9PEZI|nr:Zinc-type alcohol dehydrogenase-like protein [Lasiodiplodia theobromae]